MTMSDDELELLLDDIESELAERKESAADKGALRETVCAFANDLSSHGKQGVLFIGAQNDGQPANLHISDELLSALADIRSDGTTLPQPVIGVEKRLLKGAEMAVVFVQPSMNPPVRYRGRTWVRVGPTKRVATAEEERRLTERRRAGDLTFDMRPMEGASVDDLDLDYMRREYLPRAISPDVLEQNQRTIEEQLRSLRLLRGDTPTAGGLLAIGKDPRAWIPGAYVQFVRIDGQEMTDPIIDQKQLSGRLEDILRPLDELLELNIANRTSFTETSRELSKPDYPIPALQQVARNALMHRTYEGTNTPVRVYWFRDRVEIHSPGGPYGQVNAENFGAGATDYRNPLVAETMHNLGYAQRFGFGVPVAKKTMHDNGNPEPEFQVGAAHVAVILRSAP